MTFKKSVACRLILVMIFVDMFIMNVIKYFNFKTKIDKDILQKKHFFSKFALFSLCVCLFFTTKTAEALKLATSGDYEPYEFYKNGKLVGIDIDLCAAIEEVTGLNVIVKDTGDFDSLVDKVVNKEYDGIIAGLDKTSERDNLMSATISYDKGFVIYLQKDSIYLSELNEAIKTLKSDGTISQIVKKYK